MPDDEELELKWLVKYRSETQEIALKTLKIVRIVRK